jgi:pilus assembly protein Flp/PilA
MEQLNAWIIKQYVAATSMLQAEEGQGMVEYGLILVLVSVVVITVLTLIGTNLQTQFGVVAAAL